MVHAADHMLADELTRRGYDPDIGYPLPLGDLKIKMPVSRGFRNYRRELDMETGEVSVHWSDDGVDYTRKLFVSRTDDIVVMEVSCTGGVLDASFTLDLHDRLDARTLKHGDTPLPQAVEVTAENNEFIHYAALNDDGHDFGAVARVFSPSGTLAADSGSIHASGSNKVLVAIKLFTREGRQFAWTRLEGELEALEMDYQKLLAPHAAVHGEMFQRVQLELGATEEEHLTCNEQLLLDAYQGEAPTALVEKMWSYGRYLLISSSREGGHPCHLYGNWCGEYRGYWAFNMANENLQMIYWQALSGGLKEMMLPVFDYFDGMMDDFHENARKLYGCRGIYIPAVTTPPSGLLKTIRPHIIHWTGAAAWIAHHYFDYFLYTGDKDFLRERALPFLRETALFYEDFFTIGEDGYYISSPSNSPENSPGNYYDGKGMGAAMETTINATMDFALAKEVLKHLVDGSKLIDVYAEEIPKWEKMASHIPPYEINEDGAVKEWMHPYFKDNYHHRHQSHIYPLFPGREVTRSSAPELFKAFETAIDKRRVIGLGEQTGWSLVHMANVYARLLNGDEAVECLDLLARSCVKNNLYTTHNDWRAMGIGVEMEWAPFQIDANMGLSATIHQMMMNSRSGHISILPALPSRWRKGSITGLLARGRITVSIWWDLDGTGKIEAELCSVGQSQEINVLLPLGENRKIVLQLEADVIKKLSIDTTPSPKQPAVGMA
jgi:alpha-L-fucosidase 2